MAAEARISSLLGVEATLSQGMPVLQLPREQILAAARALRDEHGYDMLLDVTAVDWLGQPGPRFEVVWHFYSSSDCTRVRLKTRVDEADPRVARPGIQEGFRKHLAGKLPALLGSHRDAVIVIDGNALVTQSTRNLIVRELSDLARTVRMKRSEKGAAE